MMHSMGLLDSVLDGVKVTGDSVCLYNVDLRRQGLHFWKDKGGPRKMQVTHVTCVMEFPLLLDCASIETGGGSPRNCSIDVVELV
jgi:hypothetical protein